MLSDVDLCLFKQTAGNVGDMVTVEPSNEKPPEFIQLLRVLLCSLLTAGPLIEVKTNQSEFSVALGVACSLRGKRETSQFYILPAH
jgi:hypothetical protein